VRDRWVKPVYVLVSRTPATLVGLWSLLQTAAVAAAELALLPGLDDDLSLTLTSADLQEAARQVEWAHPYCPAAGLVLDVGAAPLDDVHGCRSAIGALIVAGTRTASGLLQEPDLSTTDLLSLVRILPLLASAQSRVNENQS
jgi:hypothetical protein